MYCSQCGTQLNENQRCSSCGYNHRRKSLLLLAGIFLGIAVTFAVAGQFGYRYYRMAELKARIETAMGLDAGYTETILKIESDSENMTFKELFDLCDKSVADRQKLIVDLRGLYPEVSYSLKDTLIQFLNAENDLVRAKRSFYRHQMELSSIIDRMTEHVADRPTSTYGISYYRTRFRKLKEESRKAASQMVESADTFLTSYNKLVEQELSVSNKMQTEGLRFIAIFKKYEEKHVLLIQRAKKEAVSIQSL
jgi:hypothetical protein